RAGWVCVEHNDAVQFFNYRIGGAAISEFRIHSLSSAPLLLLALLCLAPILLSNLFLPTTMSAPAAAAPAKKVPKPKKPAKPKSHPSYTDMINAAIAGLKSAKAPAVRPS
ncbi:hypothetical protein BOX15_Mlig031214g1, partial [Macrostomum lignano]